MGRTPAGRVLVFALLLAAVSGLTDARGWGEFPEFFANHPDACRSFQRGPHGSSEVLNTGSLLASPAVRAEPLGRTNALGPACLAASPAEVDPTRAFGPTLCRSPDHPTTLRLGPTGAGHPLLLGDHPDASPPVH